MSIVPATTDITVVDSVDGLLSLLDGLVSFPTNPPPLYVDLEGVQLGRHGSISVISLYVLPKKKTYLIDVHQLGESAFSTATAKGTSLKTVLESPIIPKVVFDIRNDSDALFSHYGISVDGIQDVQLMELATRESSKDFLAGLAKCIDKHSPISEAAKAEFRRMKESTSRLFDPRKGGRYEIFNERPMKPEIIQYCAYDVALLPGLFDAYNAKLRLPGQKFWKVKTSEATKDRIKLSQSPEYDGQAATKSRGPWDKWSIEQAIDNWNDDVLFDYFNGDDYDDLDDDYESDGITARDCIGWEEDMIKNGEYF